MPNNHIQLIVFEEAIGASLFMDFGLTISVANLEVLVVYEMIGFFLFFVLLAMGELLLSNLN
ncbi:hypothetical protein [Mycobacterium lepromatosis]|uniref:hypothetical protein n=1 Tax=Mycobacterium lepromatosis TaxID=480418 RepID=UPI001F23BC24|nr:hypothetical protein [Mycobacterium lepromatosis]